MDEHGITNEQYCKFLNVVKPPRFEDNDVLDSSGKAMKTDLTADYRLHTKEDKRDAYPTGEIQICFAGDTPMNGKGVILNLEFELQDENAERCEFEIKHALLNEGVKLELHNGAVEFVPKETTLLPNYPNPFNPETWIPYQLAKDTDVSIQKSIFCTFSTDTT